MGLSFGRKRSCRQIESLSSNFRRSVGCQRYYELRGIIEAGGLMAYGPSYPDLYRRTASYVDKIFNGAKPANLPIEQPTKFDLIINLKAANAMALKIPQSLLLRADRLIE